MNKLETLRCELKNKGIDAVVIFDELNQKYLSDFAFTDGLLLITASRACLITDFRYYEMGIKYANPEFEIVMPEARFEFIEGVLCESGAKIIGFEGDFLPFSTYQTYKTKFPFVEFVSIGDMIEIIRQVKTDEEIEKMQKHRI